MQDEPLEQMRLDFIGETSEAIQRLYNHLATLDASRTGSEDLVNDLFRKAHSLKGTAGMFELLDIGRIAGAIENVLEEVPSGEISLSPEVIEIILEALEEITLLLREAKGEGAGADAAAVVARIEAFVGSGEKDAAATGPLDDVKKRLPSGSLDQLRPWETSELVDCVRAGKRVVHLSLDLKGRSFVETASELLQEIAKYGRVLAVPEPAGDAGGAAFALIFVVESRGEDFDRYVGDVGGRLIEANPAGAPPAQRAPGPAKLTDIEQRKEGSHPAMAVKVGISHLDSVMSSVSELYAIRFRLAEVARGLALGMTGRKERDELLKLGLLLTRRIAEIETAITEARLVPVSLLFNRYVGEIGRLARKQGKQVDLDFEGERTQIDRALLEEIYDPVLHLIRNAVDHGIEDTEERERMGKPVRGRITLRARQESNHVRIDIEDDGAGFDFEKIEKIARARGIDEFSEADLVRLLFEPGVSTSAEVTEISGRGVGLDEVKVHIESLRGMVTVTNRPGQGACFSLLVPLTLAVSRGVVFEEGDITAVLPLTYVEEIIPYRDRLKREIEGTGSADTVRHGKVHAYDLACLLGAERGEAPRSIVIMGFGEARHAMVVGRVWGETDIATRPLPESMHAPAVIAGATELSDRRPAVIVQPEPLFRGGGGPAYGTRRRPREVYPPDVGLGSIDDTGSHCKMGVFQTADGLTAVPLNLLRQVVAARPIVEVPVFGEPWEGIFFERGLCHGLLRVGNGRGDRDIHTGGEGRTGGDSGDGGRSGHGDGGISKIAILKFPERCGVGVTRVIGEVDVAVEKIEAGESRCAANATGHAPVKIAARFDMDGEKVNVLDINRAEEKGCGDEAPAGPAET
jgi:two-component system chemotaxis sensor kinase CheA